MLKIIILFKLLTPKRIDASNNKIISNANNRLPLILPLKKAFKFLLFFPIFIYILFKVSAR